MDDAALGPVKDSPSVKASSFPCVLSFCKSRKAIRELNNIQQQEEKTAAASHGFANRNLSGPVFTPRVPPLLPRARMVWLGGCCLGLIMMLASKQVCFFYCFLAVSYFDVVVQYLQQPAVWCGLVVLFPAAAVIAGAMWPRATRSGSRACVLKMVQLGALCSD
jgi:hypothetical protein